MKHTECKDCKLSEYEDCGYHHRNDGVVNCDIPSLSACDQYGNCQFFQPKPKAKRNSNRSKSEWIPIKLRPGTDEEYEKFSQYGDCPREDFRVFECQLPDDDQEVLITTRWGEVCIDIWHRDVDCCYFEDHCDDYDVLAWMPLPEPYKVGGKEE